VKGLFPTKGMEKKTRKMGENSKRVGAKGGEWQRGQMENKNLASNKRQLGLPVGKMGKGGVKRKKFLTQRKKRAGVCSTEGKNLGT